MELKLDFLSVGHSQNLERALLKDLSLAVPSARLIGLLGANGSGKSTLLHSLAGLIPPVSGSVVYGGKNLKDLSMTDRAATFAYVAPKSQVPERLTVLELLHWANPKALPDQWIRQCRLENLVQRNVSDLSDGEKQRVMVARALMQATPIIYLDEPAAFLDIVNRHSLMKLLWDLVREMGLTIILSTHDLELAQKFCDEIWLIHEGKLHCGCPEELWFQGQMDQAFCVDAADGTQASSLGTVAIQGEGRLATALYKACERMRLSVKDIEGSPAFRVTRERIELKDSLGSREMDLKEAIAYLEESRTLWMASTRSDS